MENSIIISEPKTPFWKKVLLFIATIIVMFVMLFLTLTLMEKVLLSFLLHESESYVFTTEMVILHIIGTVILLLAIVWLYSGVEFYEFGRCYLSKKIKMIVVLGALGIYLLCWASMFTCFDVITVNGATTYRFFVSKNYTWEDVDYYELSVGRDEMLSYEIVMEDGESVQLLDTSLTMSNLSEEEYPEDVESFVLDLTRIFHEKQINLKVDWKKLDRRLYDYWYDYAKQIREIVE